jgi:NAD(P)-dependent dehydrogenase (short-subunit alcohol dehydrogenase family)
MRASEGGRIVVFSGGGASGPFPNYTAYACSKVAVVRLIETAALEMAPYGIEINCLAPGFVLTRMHKQTIEAGAMTVGADYFERTQSEIQRGGTPIEVAARAALFLASDRSSGITGKLVSARHDGWREWPDHISELQTNDIFTLRRILPKDRGMDWQ